jgi:hypothetical protein
MLSFVFVQPQQNRDALLLNCSFRTVRIFAKERQAPPRDQSPAVKNFHLPSGEMPMR